MKKRRNGNFCLQKCSFQGQSQQLLEVDQVSRVWELTPETLPSSTSSSAPPGSSRLCKWVYRYLPHAPLQLEEISSQGFLSPAVQCNGLTALVLLPLSHSRVWTVWHQKYEQQEPKEILFRLLLKQLYLLIPRAWKGIKSLTSSELLLLSC